MTDYASKYRVQTWDGSNWVTKKTVTDDGGWDEIVRSNSIATDRVRIYCHTPEGHYYVVNELWYMETNNK